MDTKVDAGRKRSVSRQAYRKKRASAAWRSIKKNWLLYVFLLPSLVYVILFCYWPMYGVQIAFRDFTFTGGFTGSKWVGLKWFRTFFESPRIVPILKNTLVLSLYGMISGFPLPIMLALILNNVRSPGRKKFAQTITYMPYFISTTVLVGMLSLFFSPSSGFVNTILESLGGSGDTYFLGKPEYFSHMYVWSGHWQGIGWGSIIYMAALAGVDPTFHEAATIDGANKLQRVWYIDILLKRDRVGWEPSACRWRLQQSTARKEGHGKSRE